MKLVQNGLALMAGLFLSAQTWAADTFKLDPTHTYVLWNINHLGFSTQSGKWYARGMLTMDKEHPENSKVRVTIDVAHVITGQPALDDRLRSKEFFDTAKYPKATFVSDKVEMTGENTAKVDGILTMHGVSKPVILDVKLNQEGESPVTKKLTVGFSATAVVKRSDYGITAYLPILGDNVQLEIEAEGVRAGK